MKRTSLTIAITALAAAAFAPSAFAAPIDSVAGPKAEPATSVETVNASLNQGGQIYTPSSTASSQTASSGYDSLNALVADGGAAQPASAVTASATGDGFDWGDALIGAGGALALALVIGGSAVAIARGSRQAAHA